MITFNTIIAFVLVIMALIVVLKGFKIVEQTRCMIIQRLGRYNRIMGEGFNIMIPFIESAVPVFTSRNGMVVMNDRIDLRETVLDVPEQSVITRDNVSINIDAILYMQITDPHKAAYKIENLPIAVAQLAQTSLRNVIGEMDLDETLASRDVINTKLKDILDEATDKWGTKVNRVELKNIMPPRDIQNAMEKQMQAERERRAKVLDAQGDRQARIERSEGEKQEQINLAEGEQEAQIRRARGEAEAIREVAQAKKVAIEEIKSAIGDSEMATQFMIANNYIETLGNFAQGEGDKVYIPYEASTALGVLGSIKELMKEDAKPGVIPSRRSHDKN